MWTLRAWLIGPSSVNTLSSTTRTELDQTCRRPATTQRTMSETRVWSGPPSGIWTRTRPDQTLPRLRPGVRFTKYLTTILRLSYDNAKVTIDLRRTSNLQNVLRRHQGFSEARSIHLQSCKIVWDSVRKSAYDIHKRNFSTFKVTIISRSYDKLTITLR